MMPRTRLSAAAPLRTPRKSFRVMPDPDLSYSSNRAHSRIPHCARLSKISQSGDGSMPSNAARAWRGFHDRRSFLQQPQMRGAASNYDERFVRLGPMSASGPKADLTAPKSDFRSSPGNRHRQAAPTGPFRAISEFVRRSSMDERYVLIRAFRGRVKRANPESGFVSARFRVRASRAPERRTPVPLATAPVPGCRPPANARPA